MKVTNHYLVSYLLLILPFFLSCSHKNTPEETQLLSDQLVHDDFTISGTYHWNFQLMGGTQHSSHQFYSDSIVYKMKGKVYATEYTMEKLSFEKSKNKWIGQDPDGIVYVLFFKDMTDGRMTMYKHKCKSNGLKEALDFDVPAADATEDHGWNIYTSTVEDKEDILPVSGTFAHLKDQLELSDSLVIYNGTPFTKMSYHAGERRWVGQADTIFLQLFFEQTSHSNPLNVSTTKFTDLKTAYKTKYGEVQFFSYEQN